MVEALTRTDQRSLAADLVGYAGKRGSRDGASPHLRRSS
jgi:hypothetical protein